MYRQKVDILLVQRHGCTGTCKTTSPFDAEVIAFLYHYVEYRANIRKHFKKIAFVFCMMTDHHVAYNCAASIFSVDV